MKTIDEKLDNLVLDVYNSKHEGPSLKLFIADKIIESNDLVYKHFLRFRKKHEKKKKKKKINLTQKKVEEKPKEDTKLKETKSKKKENYTSGVSDLSLGRLSKLLSDIDDVNLGNNF